MLFFGPKDVSIDPPQFKRALGLSAVHDLQMPNSRGVGLLRLPG